MRGLSLALAVGGLAATGCLSASRAPSLTTSRDLDQGTPLPVRYLADRFAVAPVTERGDTLILFTDTGGGANMLWLDAARRLGLLVQRVPAGRDTVDVVSLPPLASSATIPLPPDLPPFGERLMVVSPSGNPFGRDGFLGRMWFADRVWVFDYPRQSLMVLHGGAARTDTRAHSVPLGFQRDSAGRRTAHFPRIRIAVNSDSLDLLFDTGATVNLSDSARAVLAAWGAAGPAERGTSFIGQNVFDRWRTRHPEWRVIERADVTFKTPMPMIEVPHLSVAGYEVGPVWFAVRSTQSWQAMSTKMDQGIEGALGGSVLKYFRVTIDYPNAIATFERP